jgi:hypothetical protein
MVWQNFCRKRVWLLLNLYGRLFLRNTTKLFNPSLFQQTVLHRFAPCTLDTILPNPFNIEKYLCAPKITWGMAKLFVVKKLGLAARRIGFLRNPTILTPTLFFS